MERRLPIFFSILLYQPSTPSGQVAPYRLTAIPCAPACCPQAGLIQFEDSALLNIVYASLQAVLLNDPSVRRRGCANGGQPWQGALHMC